MDGRPNLRQAREAFGLSQGELGAMLGVAQVTVSEWERRNPPVKKREAIATALGLQVDNIDWERVETGPRRMTEFTRQRLIEANSGTKRSA